MPSCTWSQAAAWRMGRHHLTRRAPRGKLLEVVSRICGLHAQLLSSAGLSLWARIEGITRKELPRALWDDRTLVKTWAMRGTLHLLPTNELPIWYGALSANPRYLRPAQWQKHFGVSIEDLDAIADAAAHALEGAILTRDELADAIARITGSSTAAAHVGESSWGTILKPAAFSGRLCFGPSLGTRVRFTRPDTWTGTKAAYLPPDEAGVEIARRFLSAYGPATIQDLARWWTGGGGVAQVKSWLAALGSEVTPVDLEGRSAWMLARHVRQLRAAQPAGHVRLLPAFDPYVIAASAHTQYLLPGDFRARVFRPQGWISPVLLVDGRMAGTWRHETRAGRLHIAIQPFRAISTAVRRAAAAEADRLAAFFGQPFSFS